MSELDLEAIRARAEAATPGPWEQDGYWLYAPLNELEQVPPDIWRASDGRVSIADLYRKRPNATNDAAFIAASREDIPALLDRIAELERALAEERVSRDASDEVNEQLIAGAHAEARGLRDVLQAERDDRAELERQNAAAMAIVRAVAKWGVGGLMPVEFVDQARGLVAGETREEAGE